jgi:hypothetical protein
MKTTTDLVEFIPADDCLADRRKVDGSGTTEYRSFEDSPLTYEARHFAQVRRDDLGNVSVMAGGDRWMKYENFALEGDDHTFGMISAEFTPAQARALAEALIAAADEAEGV